MELTVTIWNEKGGITKTTTTRDLAVAFARQGKRVLAIDLDEQGSTLTDRFGYGHLKHQNIHTICENITGMPSAVSADELIHSVSDDAIDEAEGEVDLIPTHDQMQNVESYVNKQEDAEFGPDDGGPQNLDANLFKALMDAGVDEKYDVLLVDLKPAKGPILRNALYLTRNVLVPITWTEEAIESTIGLSAIVSAYEDELGVDINIAGALPTKTPPQMTTNHREVKSRFLEEEDITILEDLGIKELDALFGEAATNKESVFATHKTRTRKKAIEREQPVIENYDKLATYLLTGEIPDKASPQPVEA